MRYIPQLISEFIVQVPEDKNAYINVLNIGASGKGDLEFTGRVLDVSDGVVTISEISDGEGRTIFQYRDILKGGVQLQTFSYSNNVASEAGNITVTGHSAVGDVDFSGSPGTNPNLAPLTYFVFGYNADRGILPSAFVQYVVRPDPQLESKILSPDLWNTEQYVQLNFNRTSQFVLPVIYRVWGSRVDFLGVIGNNKVGYPGSGSITFRDLGNTELLPWDQDPELPSFMKDLFSVGGSQVSLNRKITSKETLEILPNFSGTQPSFIQCTGLSQASNISAGDTVTFKIDDTKFVRNAVVLAASAGVKEVFFPNGIYNIRDTFFSNSFQENYSNISLKGVGAGSLIKRLPSTVSNPDNSGLLNFTGQSVNPRLSGLRITSLTFDGNRRESFSLVPPLESEVTLRVLNTDNVVISDCTFRDNAGGGINTISSNSVTLVNNKIIRTGRAYEEAVSPLIIDTCENVVAQGNIMEFATTGPRVISTDFSTINGNIIRGCGDRGIDLQTSFQWNAQGNLAYSDNDSIIRSIDTYNNEYSKATIEVRKGVSLDPVFMTVTYAGESVGIAKDSIEADIYTLNSEGQKTSQVGSFRVIQTIDQLNVGIFSLTLPGLNTQTVGSKTIPSTLSLTSPDGYMYEVKASVLIGNGSRGFRPFSIRADNIGGVNYVAVQLRNSSDILGFQIYSNSTTSENDRIRIQGFQNDNISGWDQTSSYPVVGVDPDTNSILLSPIPGLTIGPTPVEFIGGSLVIVRPNYFVADGNLYVF
jgi:hypothetical protein